MPDPAGAEVLSVELRRVGVTGVSHLRRPVAVCYRPPRDDGALVMPLPRRSRRFRHHPPIVIAAGDFKLPEVEWSATDEEIVLVLCAQELG